MRFDAISAPISEMPQRAARAAVEARYLRGEAVTFLEVVEYDLNVTDGVWDPCSAIVRRADGR